MNDGERYVITCLMCGRENHPRGTLGHRPLDWPDASEDGLCRGGIECLAYCNQQNADRLHEARDVARDLLARLLLLYSTADTRGYLPDPVQEWWKRYPWLKEDDEA